MKAGNESACPMNNLTLDPPYISDFLNKIHPVYVFSTES